MGYNSAKKKMKKLGLLIALVCVSMTGFAQTQMAVLQHNDTITNIFYGTGAFVSAYNSAADGDIITLSAGNFNGCNVAKAITIKGVGARIENGNDGTFLMSDTEFRPTNGIVSVEGVNFNRRCTVSTTASEHNINNSQFTKCIMNSLDISTNTTTNVINCNLLNCFIENCNVNLNNNSSVTVINCVIYSYLGVSYSRIINSYLSYSNAYDNFGINEASFENCILTFRNGASNINSCANSSNVFVNCVAINMPKLFNNLVGGIGSNTHRTSMSEVFETFAGGPMNYYEEFILKEDFATSFPGNDGTEVGIHGGRMPFSLDPSYMIVKRCNVAGKSTIDGKLSVDIEIETEE